MNRKLKFSLELDEKENLKVEIEGNGQEIGEKLFIPFFTSSGNNGVLYAAGINTALEIAYPHADRSKRKHSIE